MKYNLEWLLAQNSSAKRQKYLYFWGHQPTMNNEITASCFSQWWAGHPFESEGIVYQTAEHYMMAKKAQLFGDDVLFDAIIAAQKPGKAKALGRQVKGFDFHTWTANRCEIVVQGNLLKFAQHEALKRFLLQTYDRILVEASPVDNIWGIGLAKDDPKVLDPAQWEGENWLGFCLMEVRDLL